MTTGKYSVRATENFKEQLFELYDSAFNRILDFLEFAGQNPKLGMTYESNYETDIPPVDCRYLIVPDVRKLLFYTVDEQKEELVFFHMVDTRSDPATRFL